MKFNITRDDAILVDGARITYKNFRGVGGPFNREGDRNFALIIPNMETADALRERGYNVKIKESREEGGEPFIYLPVKVKYGEKDGRKWGPTARLITGDNVNELDDETIGILDNIKIRNVDLDIIPYDWNLATGKSGRSAYLSLIEVTQEVDRLAARRMV